MQILYILQYCRKNCIPPYGPSKSGGGDNLYSSPPHPPPTQKSGGGDMSPPVPHRSTPMVNVFYPFQFTINMNSKIFINGDLFQAIVLYKISILGCSHLGSFWAEPINTLFDLVVLNFNLLSLSQLDILCGSWFRYKLTPSLRRPCIHATSLCGRKTTTIKKLAI